MSPIEFSFLLIGLFIFLAALARGYAKELGNTVVILGIIFILSLIDERVGPALQQAGGERLGITDATSQEARQLQAILFIGIFVSVVFSNYAGRIFTFGGRPARGIQGTILTVLIGLLNGYLVAGTIWYYMDIFGYPFAFITPTLTPTAQEWVQILPQRLVANPAYWMLPVALLILLRARG